MTSQITFTLPPELVAKVRGAVSSGDYGGVSEVLREAVRLWHHQRTVQANEAGAGDRKQMT
jgi:Arc/MetJ-type ribon-helix-helix transcriptional regulator